MTEQWPSLFKYTSADAAKIILRTGSLRWSAPSSFNDPFDGQFDFHLEFDVERVVARVTAFLVAVLEGRAELVAGNEFGEVFLAHRQHLTRADIDGEEFQGSFREGLQNAERYLPELQAQLREIQRGAKIICVSELPDSIPMWSHYAHNHEGVVLEFRHDPATDSVWRVAPRVGYVGQMPRLMDEDTAVRFLSGQSLLDRSKIMHQAIYTKSDAWAYETERRVVWHGHVSDQPFEMFGFGPSELVGVGLGCRVAGADSAEIVRLARTRYPHARIYQARQDPRAFALTFEPITAS